MRAPAALALAALVACKASGSFGSFGPSPAARGPSPSGAAAADPAPTRAVSDERVTARPGGGFNLTDAQRDADPRGDKVYAVVPLGACRDPGTMAAQNETDVPPFPTRPADPWFAVAGDQPAALPLPENRLSKASVYARTKPATCDAAHDHCLRDCTWIVRDPRDEGVRQFYGFPSHRRPDGVFSRPPSENAYRFNNGESGYDMAPGYDAYRTVPATRRLLVAGRLLAVRASVPANEREAMEPWRFGKLRDLDEEAQTVRLVGSSEAYPLAATRVVVLTYHDGGAVAIADGLARGELAVRAEETFAPRP